MPFSQPLSSYRIYPITDLKSRLPSHIGLAQLTGGTPIGGPVSEQPPKELLTPLKK